MKKTSLGHAIAMLLVFLLSLISLFPLVWMISSSFQPNEVAMSYPPKLISAKSTLDNYVYLFTKTNVVRWFINSIGVSLVSTLLVVYFSSLAAYPLAKRKFPGSSLLFLIVLAFMTIPREVTLLPLFLLMKDWGLFDSYLGILLPTVAWPFAVFLMKQFFSTIPSELIEAAEVDGCSQIRLFHTILLPMVKPAIGALAVFAFVHAWNDYTWQLIITQSDNLKSLPLGVASLSDEFQYNYGRLMAGAALGGLPIFLVFLFFQKYFISGITVGAVKG